MPDIFEFNAEQKHSGSFHKDVLIRKPMDNLQFDKGNSTKAERGSLNGLLMNHAMRDNRPKVSTKLHA